MSDTATAQRPTAEVEYLDPRTLLVDSNIRTDLRLDADFVATIVLVPIVAVRTAEGAVRVRLGNRRTLGAIEADRPTVPVPVIADEATDSAAEIERIIASTSRTPCGRDYPNRRDRRRGRAVRPRRERRTDRQADPDAQGPSSRRQEDHRIGPGDGRHRPL
jgi:hypothetical protein